LITVALSVTIGAPAERVWQALTDPNERVAWDDRILGVVGPVGGKGDHRANGPNIAESKRDADGASSSGSSASSTERGKRHRSGITQWRFRLGGIPLVMRDELLEDEPIERRFSRISIGSMHFDQTLTLHREDDDNGPRTRLSMKLFAGNRIPVIGEVVERLDVQKIIIEYVDTTLCQIQKHCEADA
jgi:hypothetical protein